MATKRTFRPITEGADVTAAIAQGVRSASRSTGAEGWGVAPVSGATLNVTIQKIEQSDMRAPAGVTFKATVAESVDFDSSPDTFPATTDLNFLLAEYYWDCDDTTASFTVPEKSIVPLHLRKDLGIGPHYCRTFDTPGTHTVNVLVYFPDGRWGTASAEVVVLAHDNGYTAVNTILVAVDNVFTGAPFEGTVDAANKVTNQKAARTRLNALVSAGQTDVRILFSPSTPTTLSGTRDWDFDIDWDNLDHLRLASWTYGTRATLNLLNQTATVYRLPNKNDGFADLQSLKFVDLEWNGGYDADLELNYSVTLFYKSNNALTDIVFHNTRSDGTNQLTQIGNGAVNGSIYINDHKHTNSNNYFALWPSQNGIFAVTGLACPANALQSAGSRPKNGLGTGNARDGNVHHGTRVGASVIYICHNHFQGRWGWGTGYKPTNNDGIRLGRNNPDDMRAVIARNVFETGTETQEGDNGDVKLRHVIFEQNFYIVNELAPQCVISRNGNFVFRNNIILKHNIIKAPYSGAGSWATVVSANSNDSPLRPDALDEPFFIYGNTLVDFNNDTNRTKQVDWYATTGWTLTYEHNNLRHEPNMTGGVSQNVSTTPLSWDSDMPGLILNYVQYEGSLPSAIAPGASSEIAYTGNFLTFFNEQLAQADFSGVGLNQFRHVLEISTPYTEASGLVDFDFSVPGFVTITNNSGVDWFAGGGSTGEAQIVAEMSGNPVTFNLTSNLLDGQSRQFSTNRATNPSGNTLTVNRNLRWFQGTQNAFTLAATATGIEITNIMAEPIPAGNVRFIVDTGDNQVGPNASWAHPTGTASLYRPNAAIAVTSGELIPLHDITGTPRKGGLHPDAAAGTLTKGASDVA